MAYTALNLITDVLLDMGVIADEQTPTNSQAVGALTKLNDLIESWNIDTDAVYGANQYILPMVAGQQTYTIGAGGNLDIPRPTLITQAFVRNITAPLTYQTDWPIPILTNQQWANIPQKGFTSSYPFLGVWFDNTFPLITAYLSPIPINSSYSLVFWAEALNSTLSINTILQLPPGYKRALKYALYTELAPGYQIDIPEEVANKAITSKNQIDRYNMQINELKTSERGFYNITNNRIIYSGL